MLHADDRPATALGPRRPTTLGRIALVLALVCVGTVSCFLFPAVLTTPALRDIYPLAVVRVALAVVMGLAVALGAFAAIRQRSRSGATAIGITVAAQIAGGAHVRLAEMGEPQDLVLALDWLVLESLLMLAVFVPLERLFPNRRSRFRRRAWRTDVAYFVTNHLGLHIVALTTGFAAGHLLGFTSVDRWQPHVQSLPLAVQVLLLFVVVDLVQYWVHRAYHQVLVLWPVHAIHHSSESLDALAGSRVHILETLGTRTLLFAAIQLIGASDDAFAIFGVVATLHATLIHSNLRLPWGPLRYVVVTPEYHHWHHSSDTVAIDKNYAGYFPLFDLLFGTYYFPAGAWPERYGVIDEDIPRSLLGQLAYPFMGKRRRADAAAPKNLGATRSALPLSQRLLSSTQRWQTQTRCSRSRST
jgi:sterol desaturase/sphingolipid hydroxylase (fatty acid hydroxylase superfamily)